MLRDGASGACGTGMDARSDTLARPSDSRSAAALAAMPAMRAGDGRIFAPRLWGGRRFRDGCVGERIWCPGACLGLAAGVILRQHSLVGGAVVVQPFVPSCSVREGNTRTIFLSFDQVWHLDHSSNYIGARGTRRRDRAQLKQGRGRGRCSGPSRVRAASSARGCHSCSRRRRG